MIKVNTFFAQATWYDDDDSTVVVRSRHREPLRGRLCPARTDSIVAEQLDHLSEKYLKSFDTRHNDGQTSFE